MSRTGMKDGEGEAEGKGRRRATRNDEVPKRYYQ